MRNRIATAGLLFLLVATTAQAQGRQDVIWARDIGSAAITLDGKLNEGVWAKAETIRLKWGERAGLPGSGWRFDGNFTPKDPVDPVEATIKILRKGNQLYVGVDVKDKSVGGARGLWNIDGVLMSFLNKKAYLDRKGTNVFTGTSGEYILSWWHNADTTDAGRPTPGKGPRFHGLFGSSGNVRSLDRTAEQVAAWDAVTVVDGIANDDTHGDDKGYVMEMRVDVTALGYDATKAGGETVPVSFNIMDTDYQWPLQADKFSTAKVWFQNQWGNNFNEGAGLLKMAPNVTVDTPVLPTVKPDFAIPDGRLFPFANVDGQMNEAVWARVKPMIQLRYGDTAVRETLPGLGPLQMGWFRPNINGNTALVVDPSLSTVKAFFRDNTLYLGVDVEDQAISGLQAEDGRDGIRFTFHARDSLDSHNTLKPYQFDFTIDSTGSVRMSGDAVSLNQKRPGAVSAAARLKGASTAANPTDADEGYQIEIAIDLAVLGYPPNRGDGWVWLSANFFDGDQFEDPLNNYATRTWFLRERAEGPSLGAFLDASAVVGTGVEEASAELPTQVELLGNYPNPFNPATTLRYALPQAGHVTVEVFDVTGRTLVRLAAGAQGAGAQEVHFDASALASGIYFYRIAVQTAAGTVAGSAVGRMVLLK